MHSYLASPCEVELQELVHQIDIMVNRKQIEWERKMRALEAKMDIQDQELASARSKLDQKGQEVGLLQQELENLQKTKNEMAQSYEAQLQALKSQVRKIFLPGSIIIYVLSCQNLFGWILMWM
uniref:CEP63/Deup1 N-terminal domain-containing protein n=1 Tax=Geospiza parvula TaxID=87175 RepID=A0A8U8BBW3_GEOPR